jgi:hypothetical protein
MNPGWLLIPAASVSPRSWDIRHLGMKHRVDVGFDVDEMFQQIAAELEVQLAPGGSELEGWVKAQRHAFLAKYSRQEAQ